MKFGYTILYVDDVEATVAFYERAFGFKRGVLVPDEFGELDTGATKLSFAAKQHVAKLFPIPFQSAGPDRPPAPVEVAFVTDDVPTAFAKAVAAGAAALAQPSQKPWGQTVAYVRDINGFLVELCTPIA
jgi:catechol 2,3-dioxygenase-like lactoylglutathione lyase family enzyme